LLTDYNYHEGIHGGGASFTVTGSTVSHNGSNGIFFNNTDNFYIARNSVDHNGELALDSEQDYSGGIRFGLYQIGAGVVEYNLVYDEAQGGIDAGMGINYDTNTGTAVTYIRYNETWGNYGAGIRVDAGVNTVVLGNVIYGNLGGNNSAGIQMAYDGTGNLIYNNTVYGNGGVGISMWGRNLAGGVVNNIFENNISVGNTVANLAVWAGGENPGTNGSGNVYNYNNFGPQASNFIRWGGGSFPGTSYSSYAAWESAYCGSGGCSHSVQANPLFVNAGAFQFWLQAGSPAIGAGIALGSPYNVGLSSSSTWPGSVVLNPTNTPPDLGAYVY
jgi:hypothetical protein